MAAEEYELSDRAALDASTKDGYNYDETSFGGDQNVNIIVPLSVSHGDVKKTNI